MISQHNCFFCKKPNHSIYKCNEFLKTTKLCVKCLRQNHPSKTCTKRDCFKCNKKHNTLLHLETKPDLSDSITAASAIGKQFSYILLATARVIIQGVNGHKAEFRALLDSGSHINAISKRAIKMLSLKTTNSMLG